ncbi:MAG: alpha/beta hydrolase [Rickettsiales bacterium]
MRFLILLLVLFGCSGENSDSYITSPHSSLKPMVVIHDGPGLTYSYLYEYLLPLKDKRNLVFYNQKSCFNKNCAVEPVEIKELTTQLERIVKNYNNNYTVLAHGWGSILLMEFLTSTPKDHHPNEVIFVNPAPLDWSEALKSFSENSENYTSEERNIIEQINDSKKCMQIFNIGLKYLLKHPQKNKKLNFEKYDCVLANYISQKVGQYDFRLYSHLLPVQTTYIYGQDSHYLKYTDKYNKNLEVISKSSHYPFYENNEEFIRKVSNILK